VGEQGQLTGLVELDGGEGLARVRGAVVALGPMLDRPHRQGGGGRGQLLAALAEGAELAAPGPEAGLLDRERGRAGMLGHAQAGTGDPARVGGGGGGPADPTRLFARETGAARASGPPPGGARPPRPGGGGGRGPGGLVF